MLFVNGAELGPVGEALGAPGVLELAPGVYRIVLKRSGYQVWRGEISVRAETEMVRVSLVPKE